MTPHKVPEVNQAVAVQASVRARHSARVRFADSVLSSLLCGELKDFIPERTFVTWEHN